MKQNPANKVSLSLAFKPLFGMFDFGGRSTRTEAVSFWLLYLIANSWQLHWSGDGEQSLAVAFQVIWAAVWALACIALTVRRLHDQGRSGWLAIGLPLLAEPRWGLLILLLSHEPLIHKDLSRSASIDLLAPSSLQSIIILSLGLLLGAIWLIILLLPGERGGNRFGADPRDDASTLLAETFR